MVNRSHNAPAERISGTGDVPVVNTSRLVGIEEIAGGLVKISRRAWLRLCEQGKAPWGVKLGSRRLWDRAVISHWIDNGCPTVREVNGGGHP